MAMQEQTLCSITLGSGAILITHTSDGLLVHLKARLLKLGSFV